jgi:hypothetical protein
LSGDTLFGDRAPYVIGPTLLATPEQSRAELAPLPSYRATIGLEYRFLDQ